VTPGVPVPPGVLSTAEPWYWIARGANPWSAEPTWTRNRGAMALVPLADTSWPRPRVLPPIANADNAKAPPFPILQGTISRGSHPWLSNTIAPRFNSFPWRKGLEVGQIGSPRATASLPSATSIDILAILAKIHSLARFGDLEMRELRRATASSSNEPRSGLPGSRPSRSRSCRRSVER
jgi:hypothetical protein